MAYLITDVVDKYNDIFNNKSGKFYSVFIPCPQNSIVSNLKIVPLEELYLSHTA